MKLYEKIWHRPSGDALSTNTLAQDLNVRPEIAQILINRSIDTAQKAQKYLHGTTEDFYDPFLLKGMEETVARIEQAIDQNEKITIYGDYDVDGISSISLLLIYFKMIQVEVDFYIPNRQEEGYGINSGALKTISDKGSTLVVTVDCGITAVEEAQVAKELGIDLIITDHHEPQAVLPDAYALVNPKQPACSYPYDMLAGVGIAFKLVQALLGDQFAAHQATFLEIAALGTVADVAPVTDENRIITKYGLKEMNQSSNLGMQALIEASSLEDRTINGGHIGFVLAPKINAAGRIGSPELGVELLTCESKERAVEVAGQLCDLNDRRQSIEKDILEEANAYIDRNLDPNRDKVLIVQGENWHTGIIGIVASRIAEKYYRPTVILNIEEGVAKGSARSVGDFNLFEALQHCSDLFTKFGGHEQAAGLSLPAENVDQLRRMINQYAFPILTERKLTPIVKLDGDVEGRNINHRLLEELALMEPFGVGNPRPQFAIRNLVIDQNRRIGKQQNHVKMLVHDDTRVFDAISFGCEDKYDFLRSKDTIDMAATLELNQFRGVETIQFMIQDIRSSKAVQFRPVQDIYEAALATFLLRANKNPNRNSGLEPFTDFRLADQTGATAIVVQDFAGLIQVLRQLYDHLDLDYQVHMNHLKEKTALDVLVHPLGTIDFTGYDRVFLAEGPSKHTAMIIKKMIPSRDELVEIYKHVRKVISCTSADIAKALGRPLHQVALGVAVLVDGDLIQQSESGVVTLCQAPEGKIDLLAIPLFKKLQDVNKNGIEEYKV